jgi:short-subunit dehydrogenase
MTAKKPWALITGASVGIGKEFAVQLAEQGYNLVLVSRTEETLEHVAKELRKHYSCKVEVLPADLTRATDRKRVAERIQNEKFPIDFLVNNAGIGLNKKFTSNDVKQEKYLLDLLVVAVLELSHAAATAMKARGNGSIIVISSVAGFIPGGTYSAAKAWTTAFAEGLNAELSTSGVRVMALCPGFTHTEFHQRAGITKSSIPDFLWLNVNDLVRTAFNDFARGEVVSVPNWKYKALVIFVKLLPRDLARIIWAKSRHKLQR